jgi:hypothetical protein
VTAQPSEAKIPDALILPAVKVPYGVRMQLIGMTQRQLDLVWYEVFREDRDPKAVARWCVSGQRLIEIERIYAEALTAERNLILSLALLYYPRMARQIMKGLRRKPKPRKSTRKSTREKIVKFRHPPE